MPTPTDTATPAPTVTPTPTPTLTATPVPNGPCDNPLVPLGVGYQWTYRLYNPQGESGFFITSPEIQTGANVVVRLEYTDPEKLKSYPDSAVCLNGAIVNYPLFVFNMLVSDYLDYYIDTYHMSVNYAPSYQELVWSNWRLDWQSVYLTESESTLQDPAGGPAMFIPKNTQMQVAFTTDKQFEAVSVPAGDFPQAFKLNQDYTVPVLFIDAAGGGGSGAILRINTTQWYEPYLGLLRAEITGASLQGTQTFPLEGRLELIKFARGNRGQAGACAIIISTLAVWQFGMGSGKWTGRINSRLKPSQRSAKRNISLFRSL